MVAVAAAGTAESILVCGSFRPVRFSHVSRADRDSAHKPADRIIARARSRFGISKEDITVTDSLARQKTNVIYNLLTVTPPVQRTPAGVMAPANPENRL